MKILIIGGGGREHALTWKVAQSSKVSQVFVAPGNAGTAMEHKVKNIAINNNDCEKLLEFALQEGIDLTIVGPEAPLSLGIVDLFQENNLRIFGPKQASARLESSKAFCKDFLKKNKIPTATYQTFTDINAALSYAKKQDYPLVIKADGLAAGKGVIIAENYSQAQNTICEMLAEKKFGEASQKIVIEEFLEGEELSYIVMVDGKHILPLASSQDHKRLLDHDQGPNTGGMGAYSPAPLLTEEMENIILQKIIQPTVRAMQRSGTPYTGFLYAGLMVSPAGAPKVLEFNCRLGDPETQPILMRLESDLIDLFVAALEGKLNKIEIQWDPRFALAVVMAAGGYPEDYKTGDLISGWDQTLSEDCKIFHAGTQKINKEITTHGGRVLAVVALGDSVQITREKAYKIASKIKWRDVFYRKDIGYRALEMEKIQIEGINTSQLYQCEGSANRLLNACSPLLTLISELKTNEEPLDFDKLRATASFEIKAMEENAQKKGVKQDTILAARYLLCAFFDETIRKKYGNSSPWESRTLLKTFLIEPTQVDQFFHILDNRLVEPQKHTDLLELAYIALSLGYQGSRSPEEVGRYLDNIYEILPAQDPSLDWSTFTKPKIEKKSNLADKLPPVWVVALAGLGFLAVIWLPYHQRLEVHSRIISEQIASTGNLNAKPK